MISSPAARAFWKRCRKPCRACASSRRSRWKRTCAPASTLVLPTSRTNRTNGRASPTAPADEGKPPLKLSKARLEFANVQFAYRPGEKVIRNLSFVAEPGNVSALVGPSGGGKSTILNLILRFYDVDSGAIIIDGQNIAAVSRRSLRSQVAYV